MTRITLYRTADQQLCGFECRGHAGYAEAGSDIVCAAVSVLATTCANALESVAGVSPGVEAKDGYMRVQLSEGEITHDASVILRTFEQGIHDIAISYPQYIHITKR